MDESDGDRVEGLVGESVILRGLVGELVGAFVGESVGAFVGAFVGAIVTGGCAKGLVGASVILRGLVGELVGALVGAFVGSFLFVGKLVGKSVGSADGLVVVLADGLKDPVSTTIMEFESTYPEVPSWASRHTSSWLLSIAD